MFAAAAECLAAAVTDQDLESGSLYPGVGELRNVTRRVAEAVVRVARDGGVGQPLADEAIPRAVAEAMWEPRYLPYERA